MKRVVRIVIRLIAAGIIVIGVMGLGLELARFKQHRPDFGVWHCVFDFLSVALGVVLFAASSKLANQMTDDFDE